MLIVFNRLPVVLKPAKCSDDNDFGQLTGSQELKFFATAFLCNSVKTLILHFQLMYRTLDLPEGSEKK